MISAKNYKILMKFLDVEMLYFNGDGQVVGFYIQDMNEDGYENDVRYRVGDCEGNEIEFYCSDVIIEKFDKVSS